MESAAEAGACVACCICVAVPGGLAGPGIRLESGIPTPRGVFSLPLPARPELGAGGVTGLPSPVLSQTLRFMLRELWPLVWQTRAPSASLVDVVPVTWQRGPDLRPRALCCSSFHGALQETKKW